MLAGDDLAAIALELAGFGAARSKRLALLDERGNVALEALDAGITVCHDSTYDVRMQTLAAPNRKKCVSVAPSKVEGGPGPPSQTFA